MQEYKNSAFSIKRIALATAVSSVMGLSSFSAQAESRIIGGNQAAKNEFPHMAALVNAQQASAKNGQFCGASIIAPQWAITAAHCVEHRQADNIDVLIKTNSLESGGTRIRSAKIYSNSDYAQAGKSDIALIKLSKNADVAAILPLSPNSKLAAAGTLATVSGWGLTKENGPASSKLMKVDVPLVADSICEKAYGEQFQANVEICAGLAKGGKDSCQGDSGGPLMVKDKAGKPHLAGIVSWGDGCAQAGKFGVYTEVAAHSDWINKVLKGGVEADKPTNLKPDDFANLPELPGMNDDITILPCEGDALLPDLALNGELNLDNSFGDDFNMDTEHNMPGAKSNDVNAEPALATCEIKPIGEFKVDFTQKCQGSTCTFEAKLGDSKLKVEEYVWDIIDTATLNQALPEATKEELAGIKNELNSISLEDFMPTPANAEQVPGDIPSPSKEDEALISNFVDWKVGKTIEHKFAKAGKYQVYLSAFSNDGKFGHATKEVSIGKAAAARAAQSTYKQKQYLAQTEQYISQQAPLTFGQALNIQFKSPDNADFDLFLERLDKDSKQWTKVDALTSSQTIEELDTIIRQAGEYRVRIVPYHGIGEFEFAVEMK